MLLVHGIGSHHMEGLRLTFVLRVHASTTVRAFTGTLYVVKVKLCLVLILD